MSKNSRLMIHNPIGGMHGSIPDLEVELDEIQRLRDNFVQHIADCSNLNFAEVKDLINRNKYLSAEEAIQFGLLDGVVTSYKEIGFE